MKNMIKGYTESCVRVKQRIDELTLQRNILRKNGDTPAIEELDLERRIKLLYAEYEEMQETIVYLTSYMRRREESAQT